MIITRRFLIIYAVIVIGLSVAGLAAGYRHGSQEIAQTLTNDISHKNLALNEGKPAVITKEKE